MLARSLCAAQKLILLDEPTTGLDPVAAEDFYRLLQKLNRELKITVIMVSHDIREALECADHILYLSHSSHFFGTTDAFLESGPGKEFVERITALRPHRT